MEANQTETHTRRRTRMLPALAAGATLLPAVAGLALLQGPVTAARPAVSFRCPTAGAGENGNGTSANPADDNTDVGLDAGATAGGGHNTATPACGATTTTVPAPVTTVSPTTPTLDRTDPTVTTAPTTSTPAPAAVPTTTTSATTTVTAPATTAPATTVGRPSPTVATLPEAPGTTVPVTTVPVTFAFRGPGSVPGTPAPSTTVAQPAAIIATTTTGATTTSTPAVPTEIAPNEDGPILNGTLPPSVLAFTVTKPGSGIVPTPLRITVPVTMPVATWPSSTARPTTERIGIATDVTGLTPPPVEVLGMSISNFAWREAAAPSGLAEDLAFTGSTAARLASLAGSVLSLGFGLAAAARRSRRTGRA